ncbi:hypothetical protein [Enterococcus sp. DIV1059_2]|uniref:hypothetical protein n=1 Tax=Enterococcus sp. DIV1059_2 TaxID=2774664 RepID=UPI003F206D32
MDDLKKSEVAYLKDLVESRLQELKGLLREFSNSSISCKVDIENEISICESVLNKLR